MKRFLFLLVLMIFSTFLQAQNLVKINDYSKNFNNDVNFNNFIFSADTISVLSKKNNGFLISDLNNSSKNTNLISGSVTDYCQSDENIYTLQIMNQNSFNFLSIKKLSKSFSPEKEANYKLSSSISNIYIACDDENNLYIAANYSGDFFIDNNNFNTSIGTDVFVLKLNENLEIINSKSINYKGNETLNDIAFFENKLLLIGTFDENFANQTSLGKSDAFVLILDTDFNVVKNFQYSSIYDESCQIVKVNENNLYLTGYFSGQIEIGDSLYTSKGAIDLFVCQYDENLNLIWTNHYGSTGNDYLSDISTNTNGDIFLTGTNRSELNLDNSTNKTLFFNTYIVKFNQQGEFNYYFPIIDSTTNYYTPKIFSSNKNTILVSSNSSDYNKSQSYLHEYFDCDYGLKIDLPEAITVYNTDTLFTANNNFEEYKWNTGCQKASINLNSDGIYYLTVKDKNGCLSMDSMYVEILNKNGVSSNNQLQNNFKVQVFPNPAVDNININAINLDIKNDCQIFLFSENGSIVYYKQYSTYTSNHDYTINTNFANGNYVLKIINGKNSYSKKIIILK